MIGQEESSSQQNKKLIERETTPVSDAIQKSIQTRILSHVLGVLGKESTQPRFFEKLPGPMPVSISRKHLRLLQNQEYWVAEKSDGLRYMFYHNEQGAFMIDRKFNVRMISNPFYHNTFSNQEILVDGELINGDTFLIYDAIFAEGTNVGQIPSLRRRLESVGFITLTFRKALGDNVIPFSLLGKNFYQQIDDVIKSITKLGSGKYVYSEMRSDGERHNMNDGLIFTPEAEPYIPRDKSALFKWKWFEMITIDLAILQLPADQIELYAVGDKNVDILFATTPSNTLQHQYILDEMKRNNQTKAIVEVGYNANISQWEIHSFRHDKTTPNYIDICIQTMESMIENITLDEIKKASKSILNN